MKSLKQLFIFTITVSVMASCGKKDLPIESSTFKLDQKQIKLFNENLSSIPMIIKYYDEDNDRFVDFDVRNRTVTFNKTWNFANPEPNTIYGSSAGGIVVYISSGATSWGYGTPTHSVSAGSTTLNVQTLCLAVDCSAYAALFAGQTGQLPIDGFSCVMGLDADFSLLANSSSTNFGNYFSGLAYYLVYDFQASGSYGVIDWSTWSGLNFPNGLAYAMVFSFGSNNFGSFYFSQSGDIDVSGGDMTFNGDYWGIEYDFTNITPDLTYSSFPGSGTMGCN